MMQNEIHTVSTEEQTLLHWLEAYLQFKGRGAKTEVAESLGISPSGLSKILERGSGFDLKTIRLMSLIMSSKDEHYPRTDAAMMSQRIGNLSFTNRPMPDGSFVITWKPAAADVESSGIDETLDTINE